MSIPVLSLRHLGLLLFVILATLIGVQWYLILVCNFLMISNDKHLFIYLFATCISSLVRNLFQIFCLFFESGFAFFLLLSVKSCLYILNTNLLSSMCFAKDFFPVCSLSFHSLKSVFHRS